MPIEIIAQMCQDGTYTDSGPKKDRKVTGHYGGVSSGARESTNQLYHAISTNRLPPQPSDLNLEIILDSRLRYRRCYSPARPLQCRPGWCIAWMTADPWPTQHLGVSQSWNSSKPGTFGETQCGSLFNRKLTDRQHNKKARIFVLFLSLDLDSHTGFSYGLYWVARFSRA